LRLKKSERSEERCSERNSASDRHAQRDVKHREGERGLIGENKREWAVWKKSPNLKSLELCVENQAQKDQRSGDPLYAGHGVAEKHH
jgi:hypothetical protein